MRTAEISFASPQEQNSGLVERLKERLKKALELPDSIGVLMQKYRQFALEHKREVKRVTQEAGRLYPLFLAQYKLGITNYKLYAKAHGHEFAGVLKHPTYPNQELKVYLKSCCCEYSTVTNDEKGSQGDIVTIRGDIEGKEVWDVSFYRWKDSHMVEGGFIKYYKNLDIYSVIHK